jgi:hypothetical protein
MRKIRPDFECCVFGRRPEISSGMRSLPAARRSVANRTGSWYLPRFSGAVINSFLLVGILFRG